MSPKKMKIIFTGLLFGFCIVLIIYGFLAKHQLKNKHKLGIAYLNNCSTGGLGNAGRLVVDYTININGKKYKGSSMYQSNVLSYSNCYNFFIGRTYPVVYNLDNLTNSSILIIPEDFDRYGYSFPDSLKWVLQYKK